MITIFNRIEFIITYNQKEWLRVRDLLEMNGIEYATWAKAGSIRTPLFKPGDEGLDPGRHYQYRIYIKRKDQEKASRLMNGNW